MMDLTKVYVAEKDFPENKEEVINDILNRIYSQENTTLQWQGATDFLSWGNPDEEAFIFLRAGSDGEHWDLDAGSSIVMNRYKLTEQVDFASWYAAIKEKFKVDETVSTSREIYLPAVAFKLLVKAATENVHWSCLQPTEQDLPTPLLDGKRVFLFMGVCYVEE